MAGGESNRRRLMVGAVHVDRARLFDDVVSPPQHRLRDRQAEGLRGFEIDDQVKLAWLLNWQIRRLRASQNPAGERAEASVSIGETGTVRDEATRRHVFLKHRDRWQTLRN